MTIKCPKCHSDNPDTKKFCGECGTQLPLSEEIPISPTKTMQAPKEELTTGSTFAGRYQIIEELGEGGMGKVYKVHDTEIKEKIALKLIKPEISADKKIIERFQNELKLARKIGHKNVCRMYDLNKEEGSYYITMEYVSGEDLKSLIRKIGQLSAGQAIPIAKQVCEGLEEAHRLGIVHRDLKPKNIMVDEEGNARIMDFGIARSLEAKGVTDAGVMIGTPEYMSPEQVEGKETDQRSDIYSLGVILYEMVTGSVPFWGNTPLSIAVKHKTEIPREPQKLNPRLHKSLNHLILKCIEKNKEERYQDVKDILDELNQIEKEIPTSEKILADKKSFFSSLLHKLKNSKSIKILAAFIGVGVAIVEFVHHIIINHYQFPKETLDITVVTILCVFACTLIWQLCYGVEKRRRRIKIEFILIPSVILITAFLNFRLFRKMMEPEKSDQPETSTIGKVEKIKSIAILPFTVLGNNPEDRAFCCGLVNIITQKLTHVEHSQGGLWVVPIFEGRDSEIKSPGDAGGMLGVNFAMRGNLQRMGDMFRLTLKLVNAKDLRSVKFPLVITDPITNLSTWQQDIIIKILQMLDVEPLPKTLLKLSTEETALPEAYKSYLIGLGYMQNPENEENIDMAINILDQAIEQDSQYAAAHLGLAEAIWYKYKLTQNKELIRSAQAHCKLALQLGHDPATVHVMLGTTYRGVNRYEEAINEFKEAIQIEPNYFEAHLKLALAYEEFEKLAEAEETYNQAIELRPHFWLGYDNLGYFYWVHGRMAEAEKKYLKVTELTPERVEGYSNLGVMYFYIGKIDSAISMFEKSINIKRNLEAFSNLGTLYFFNGRYSDAIASYLQALEFDKNDYIIWENLADTYRHMTGFEEKTSDTYKKAYQLASEELEDNPEDSMARASLAYYCAVSGEQTNALAEISRAIKQSPDNTEVLLQGIKVYEFTNQRDLSLKTLQEYIEGGGAMIMVLKNPDFSELRNDPRYQKLTKGLDTAESNPEEKNK